MHDHRRPRDRHRDQHRRHDGARNEGRRRAEAGGLQLTSPAGVLVEACVESARSALAAERVGAGRVELCANLAEDGTTPPRAELDAAGEQLSIPIVVMIRPRAGDFVYSPAEVDTMLHQVAAARAGGAAGVALGTLTTAGDVDEDALRALVRAAGPLPVTFHRAFDRVRDPERSLDTLIAAGVARVLTSGGAPSAREGLRTIAALVVRARRRIAIVAGGKVDAESAAALVRDAGIREVHVGDDPARLRAVVTAVSGSR
ncbi:MAG TPA: copper homeostasis protein CutC [Gemmatimonadaceae bacterium]|nr:copper homeostasis protein CutC [Gemmatimonadaceae bacterium]